MVNSLAAPLLGSKTELLAQPELELLTRPFKVRRLTVRPIGGLLASVQSKQIIAKQNSGRSHPKTQRTIIYRWPRSTAVRSRKGTKQRTRPSPRKRNPRRLRSKRRTIALPSSDGRLVAHRDQHWTANCRNNGPALGIDPWENQLSDELLVAPTGRGKSI